MSNPLNDWRTKRAGQQVSSRSTPDDFVMKPKVTNVLLLPPTVPTSQQDFSCKGLGAGYFDKKGNLRTNAAFHVKRAQLDRTTGLRTPGSTIERPLRGQPRMINKANISTRV